MPGPGNFPVSFFWEPLQRLVFDVVVSLHNLSVIVFAVFAELTPHPVSEPMTRKGPPCSHPHH